MFLLIRAKANKPAPTRRRSNPITAVKKIGAFAYQFFLGVVGLILTIGFASKSDGNHDLLRAVMHNFVIIAESILLILLTVGFLFVKNREEH